MKSLTMEEEGTAEYQVQSENGQFLTVLEYTTITTVKSRLRAKRLKGSIRFELLDGRAVNRIGDDSFKISETGGLLRKV